jgi:methylenetetrahydrofolate dehydrogenase (NADP+)/methenyltetrahydrofolate cyclohydrolase
MGAPHLVLLDIKEYVKSLKESFVQRIGKLPRAPKLAIVQVGNDPASMRYVRNKIKDCKEVGIDGDVYAYPENITEFELDDELKHLQEFYDGVIVQLPLPLHIRSSVATNAINPEKDVDGFRWDSPYNPATPKGIMDYLKYCDFDLTGRDVVIIGRSEIVGKPLARMMTDADATVTLCHSRSRLEPHLFKADLIVSAVGKAGFLDCAWVGCPVIDVGINFDESGKMVGDCFNTKDKDVTPVPGGVGLLTRCALLDNVITATERSVKNA